MENKTIYTNNRVRLRRRRYSFFFLFCIFISCNKKDSDNNIINEKSIFEEKQAFEAANDINISGEEQTSELGNNKVDINSLSWKAVSDTATDTEWRNRINGIAYGDGRFVAIADRGRMSYSDDGIHWTAVSNSTFESAEIFAIAYSSGIFVAGGAEGRLVFCKIQLA